MWEFIKEMLWGVLWSYQSIAFWFGFALLILWFILPKIRWEGKMKQKLGAASWPGRLLIILGFLYISTIITSYKMYTRQQQTITKLQETQTLKKQDTKQEIRTFLESINPEILRRIDKGQEEILTYIKANYVKLAILSEHPDFEKYLSFRHINNDKDDFTDFDDPNIFIDGDVHFSWIDAYYLYPKDALIK
jgi:hypothetical protein